MKSFLFILKIFWNNYAQIIFLMINNLIFPKYFCLSYNFFYNISNQMQQEFKSFKETYPLEKRIE